MKVRPLQLGGWWWVIGVVGVMCVLAVGATL